MVICGYLFLLLKGISTLKLKSYSACYGTLNENFLRPSCATGEKMAVVGIYALAKELGTSCPIQVTTPNTVPVSCCQYDPTDCSIRYVGATYRLYYQQCNGNIGCTRQVSWISTTCNQTVHLASTNYMKMDYYCISDQVLDSCSSLNTTDDRVFLWNLGYPWTSLTGSSTCTCSVEASCYTTVRLTALDLRLGNSTTCDQSITITDGRTVMTFDCNDNNDYLPITLYVSTSYFIQIQVADNLGLADGYYFLLFEGTSSGAELTLSCGSTALTTPSIPSTSLPDCPSTDFTTESKTIRTGTSTESYISSEGPTSSVQSTNIELMTSRTVVSTEGTIPVASTETFITSGTQIPSRLSTNVESMTITTVAATTNSTSSVIKDAYTTSGIPQTFSTNTDLTSTRKSEVTTTNDVKATEKITTKLNSTTNNKFTIPSGNTTNRSTAGISNSTEINNLQTTAETVTYSSTQPVSVSLGWTSTVQNLTVTRSFTPISSSSVISQKAHTTEVEQTTYTNVTLSVDKSSPIRSPLIIGLSVTVIVICILVLLFMLYRYKRKGHCCMFSQRTNEESCRVYQMTKI
ncbi:uncharacterized protein LOC143049107 [Mytilus galloprovincialis]|uniref:uncharacterized protein LOC143049107 n=1 Tax=Mytilus galloprovincialis TaxID=29158 RepID=UPI003F7BEE82